MLTLTFAGRASKPNEQFLRLNIIVHAPGRLQSIPIASTSPAILSYIGIGIYS